MRTDHAGETIISCYGLFVVAFSPLVRLGKIDCILLQFPLEIEFMYTTLSDH